MSMIEHMRTELKETFIETANRLKGHERRRFMARIVRSMGRGGAAWAERELGRNRKTVSKGCQELDKGQPIQDNFSARGRKKAEHHLPYLLADIKTIVEEESQTDATFRTTKLYTRLSAEEVHNQLIEQKGYTAEELATANTIGIKLNKMGYHLRPVVKSKPQKKLQKQTPSLTDWQK
jgi:hypothetical protein